MLTTDNKADEAAKGVVPASTQRMNDWALKTFNNCQNPEIVCKWLSWFVLEVYQQSGDPYPQKH